MFYRSSVTPSFATLDRQQVRSFLYLGEKANLVSKYFVICQESLRLRSKYQIRFTQRCNSFLYLSLRSCFQIYGTLGNYHFHISFISIDLLPIVYCLIKDKWKIQPTRVGIAIFEHGIRYQRNDRHRIATVFSRLFTGMTGLVNLSPDTAESKSIHSRVEIGRRKVRGNYTRGSSAYERNINDTWNFQLLSNSALTRSARWRKSSRTPYCRNIARSCAKSRENARNRRLERVSRISSITEKQLSKAYRYAFVSD